MWATLYDQIAEEISGGQIDRGLWTEAYTSADGDERLTRARYVKLRLRRLRASGARVARTGNRARRSGAWTSGSILSLLRFAVTDLTALWMWCGAMLFAAFTAAGLLSLTVKCTLRLFDDGLIAWPIVTAGSAAMLCFCFRCGIKKWQEHPPTLLFYVLEWSVVAAAIWALSRVTEPSSLAHLPRVLIPELVYLMVRLFHSGDSLTNLLSVAMFILPVYGLLIFVRQRASSS